MKNNQTANTNRLVIALLAILVIVLGFFAVLVSSKDITFPKKYEQQISKIEKTSDSDDVESIESDLEETDLDSLDVELSDIQAELN